MKKILFVLLIFILFVTVSAYSATRVFYEDCEDTDISEHFLEEQFGTSYLSYWNELKAELTQSGTHYAGSYSATYNPYVTGNPHASLGVGNVAYGNTSNFSLSSVNARYWYFRWYQRWTSGATYTGANKNLYINSQPSGDYVFVIEKTGSAGFHIMFKDNATYSLIVNTWATHSGGSLDDDEWHKYEVFIDSGTTGGSNGDYWIKIDDITLKSGSGYNFNSTIHSNPIDYVSWPSNTSSATGSQVIYVDDLEIWIDGIPDDPEVPEISVTDSIVPNDDLAMDFGTVYITSYEDATVTVTNVGDANLTIGTLSGLAAPFAIQSNDCNDAVIAPSEHCTCVVRFSPTSTGAAAQDTLIIPSDDGDENPVNVTCDGEGMEPPSGDTGSGISFSGVGGNF